LVFDNVISNAKKVVDEYGTIKIQVSVDGDDLKISVKD